MKSIFKEICIILLLIIAILLALGILFYEHMPNTKKVPSKVAEYTLPQEMTQELEEIIKQAETQNIVRTYRVDSDDLARDVRTRDYVKGKPNPFAKVASGNTTTNTNNNGNNIDNTNSTTQNNNQGSFLNEVK